MCAELARGESAQHFGFHKLILAGTEACRITFRRGLVGSEYSDVTHLHNQSLHRTARSIGFSGE
ncbi:MAG TPA: hypothetical protein VF600_17745 [Abditibacteriaceae bacterium]